MGTEITTPGTENGRGLPNVATGQINETRKLLSKQAGEIAGTARELEQLALIDEVPFEEAFCLLPEEVKKRYTAENARQIEWRRDAAVKLLARQCAASDIADILGMNPRTVAAIAAQEGQRIGTLSEQFSNDLIADAASDIALARTKRDGASFKDLHIGAGIKLTHAVNLRMVSAGGADVGDALDVESENPALTLARKFLESRKQKAEMEK